MITIYVQKTQARAELDAPVTSGSVGREVRFQFSDDWAGLTKIAVFETNNYKEPAVVPESGTLAIPEDVLAYPGYQLRIGVIGKSADGATVIPTVYADCGAIKPGASTVPVGTPPTPSQAEQLQAQIDELKVQIPTASGGMSATAADLLVTILRNAEYSTDQSDNITALATALNATPEPDAPDVPDEPIVVRYAITNTLTECTNSNAATSLTEGASYTATLTASEGFALDSVTVMMGGVDVTASVYADCVITISAVTGDVVITAVAVEESTYPFTPDEPYAITWTEGYAIDNGTSSETFGENVEDSGLAVSDYLPVSGASAVELSTLYTNYGIWFYDADKTAICRMNINESYPAPVARDAAYVRAQCRVANVGVASVTPKVFDVLGENTAWESGKYYVLDGYEPTAALNANTGAETTASSWWRSGYCFCYGATEMNLTAYLGYRATLVFYDAEKNYISGSTRNIEAAVTVPENATYFRVSTAMITSYDARYNTDNLWVTLT